MLKVSQFTFFYVNVLLLFSVDHLAKYLAMRLALEAQKNAEGKS
jgi:hypothetical protein